jgi:hypothetical protein
MAEIKTMTTEQLVSEAIRLDQEQKNGKKVLDAVKAELQARGLQTIEDRNVKFIRYYSPEGSASIVDSQSMDVLNVDRLKTVLSEGVWKSKVTEETKTSYKYDKNLEKMLKAVFTGDYTFDYTLEEFFDEMTEKPDDKQKKLLLKKLKGEYVADRKTLMSVFGHTDDYVPGDYFDVELWYIYKIKNGELIQAFLPEEFRDATIAEIKKCLIVDSKTSITIDYDKN